MRISYQNWFKRVYSVRDKAENVKDNRNFEDFREKGTANEEKMRSKVMYI